MNYQISYLSNKDSSPQHRDKALLDIIVNTNESRIRIGIKEAEQSVREEAQKRKADVPLSVEQHLLHKL